MALECDFVPEVRLTETVTRHVKSRASYRYRGEMIRREIEAVEQALRARLTVDALKLFVPDPEAICGVTHDWLMERLASIALGRGLSQENFARIMPIFWRLPHYGWSVAVPQPPKGVVVPMPVILSNGTRAFLPLDHPANHPSKSKKEAA